MPGSSAMNNCALYWISIFTPAWLPHSKTKSFGKSGFEDRNTAGWSAFGSPTLTR